MARDFSGLNKYAKREYKFVQADSYRLITQDVAAGNLGVSMNGGVCMGATLKWIKEKLSTSNGLFKPEGPLRHNAPKQFSNSLNPLTRAKAGLSVPGGTTLGKVVASNSFLKNTFKGNSHQRNEGTMRQAADLQTLYHEQSEADAIDSLSLHRVNYPGQLIKMDLTHRLDPDAAFGGNWELAHMRGHNPSDHQYLLAESIAPTAQLLRAGVAILINLANADGGGGHALAFYRSRPGIGSAGRTLYFFDSNAGAYKIANDSLENIQNLLRAWAATYANHIVPVTFQIRPGYCTAFERS